MSEIKESLYEERVRPHGYMPSPLELQQQIDELEFRVQAQAQHIDTMTKQLLDTVRSTNELARRVLDDRIKQQS